MYKFVTTSRDYSQFNIIPFNGYIDYDLDLAKLKFKLFSEDIFTKDELKYSYVREHKNIAGILILENNNTYGRNNKGKLQYKCIPSDKTIPCFIIPYDNKEYSFSKVLVNLYITFTFNNWDSKHPYGTISNIIGPVNDIDNYYVYQIFSKNLNYSLNSLQKKNYLSLNSFIP